MNSGSISGGAGAYDGGTGGNGVQIYAGTLSNTGTILGGAGGQGYYQNGGTGGAGVALLSGTTASNGGTITGGAGGYGHFAGGMGGVGVSAADAMLTNTGVITGGRGGIGGEYTSGTGGTGVTIGGGTLIAGGTITGGQGGGGAYQPAAGNGGVGVSVDGGTLVAEGTISGGAQGLGYGVQGDAVSFGAQAGTLVIDPGARFNGLVAGNAGVADALVLAGTSAGTLSGLGMEFAGFSSLTVDNGAHWTLAGLNTATATTPVLDFGTLSVTGTFTDARATVTSGGVLDVVGAGKLLVRGLTLSGGALDGGAKATVAIGTTLTDAASGAITVESGGSVAGFGTIGGAGLVDNGELLAQGGTLTLATSVSGSGSAVINNGTLFARAAVGGVGVDFSGAGSLVLGVPTSLTSTLSGFGAGDTIDLRKLVATSLSYAGGTLTLDNGTTVVDRISFAGTYTAANFALSSDGHGGTDIKFVANEATAHGLSAADFGGTFGPELAHGVAAPVDGLAGGWHGGEADLSALAWTILHNA